MEPWHWKHFRNFLLVMDNQKKVEGHKMRSIHPLPFLVLVYLSLCQRFINYFPVYRSADAISSKRLQKTRFKSYTDEFGAGPSLPQNVILAKFNNYQLLFFFFKLLLSSIHCRCYDEMPLQELQATQEQQTIQNLCDTLRTILRL